MIVATTDRDLAVLAREAVRLDEELAKRSCRPKWPI
jgi:hypothetical protein